MPDMLVKLYDLPPAAPVLDKLRQAGIEVRRPLAGEKQRVVEWVRRTFSPGWASECDVAFSYQPVAAFIAHRGDEILGFACYDVACRNFFGPTGVAESARKQGIGTGLLLAALHAQRALGYGYAIIGWVGPADYYARVVGAKVIEGSEPGIYRGMLKGG
ncbi:MAG: GNAT family N-acetyltransferase [Planctomycetota bacterium]|nr:GNAT family N-acetyltransferase [Planctomycetota bacterium]